MSTFEELKQVIFAKDADAYTWGAWKELLESNGCRVINDDSGIDENTSLPPDEAQALVCRLQFEFDPSVEPEAEFATEDDLPAAKSKVTAMLPDAPPMIKQRIQPFVPQPQPQPQPLEDVIIETAKQLLGKNAPVAESTRSKPSLAEMEKWRQGYFELIKYPPIDETLGAESGKVRINFVLREGVAPLLTTQVYVPNGICKPLHWFALSEGMTQRIGWHVLLLPRARDEVLRQISLDKEYCLISKIRIVRMAASEKSLLAEVAEW